MRIFNKDKTKEIFDYTEGKGYLIDDQIQIGMSEEVPFIEEKGHYEVVREFDNGSKESKWVVDEKGQDYKPSEPIYENIKVFEPFSKKDLLDRVRDTREWECFSVINRGGFWYDTLTPKQKEELKVWYNEWLTATDKVVEGIDFNTILPKKPEWLK